MGLKEELKTTPRYVSILEENGIHSMKDFFNHFPRTYENRTDVKPLNALLFDEKGKTSTKGHIVKKNIIRRGNKMIYDIQFHDINGAVGYISIFNSWFLASKIIEWNRYIIVWKPQFKYGKIIFSHPDIVPATAEDTTSENPMGNDTNLNQSFNSWRIFPIYSEMQGIKPWWFAQKIWNNLTKVDTLFQEYLPENFIKIYHLLPVTETIKNLHFPENDEKKNQALYRLFFDRLLRIQLYSLLNKDKYQKNKEEKSEPQWEILKKFIEWLPFSLTHAQKKVLLHIVEDFHNGKPMMRLLQGDVGSWKTIVAVISAFYIRKQFQGQSVILAPLEVLTNQHFLTFSKFLLSQWIRVELLTWSLTKTQKDKIKEQLKNGTIQVLVATHAVLQDDVMFKNLKFVCIDEQHKFGVKQRAKLQKFNSPHILQMSATPIPRSMALAFFGEFDVSIIDELPSGRIPITTKVISEKEYLTLKPWILQKINQGQKVFIVTPLIEESDKIDDVKSALQEYEQILNLFPELWSDKVGLLHGKLSSKEKDQVMQEFKTWKKCLLVSTTVIEVWVDIPEATIMIIKSSERFWLSQLHQLRWRIWRSNLASYCFLETQKKSGDTYERLKVMESTSDWFKLAEIDLQNRGAGELLGTMQSWISDIPLEILNNLKFMEKVREWAERLLTYYPQLEGLPLLQSYLEEKISTSAFLN